MSVHRLPPRGASKDSPPGPSTSSRTVVEAGRPGGEQSLDFTLLAAAKFFELGYFQAGLTALCDAIFVAHTGDCERVDPHRLTLELRAIAGTEWMPPEAA